MTELGFDEWMVAWNRGGDVRVGPWPDKTRWSQGLSFTDGCCMSSWHEISSEGKVALMFIHFHTIVVRDRVDPQRVHQEFLKIGEYRRRISPEIPGAAS